MKLTGQTIVITGGASGMGQAAAAYFAKQGLRVIIWDLKPGTDAACIACDVSDSASVAEALAATVERAGIPRILVNCAGIAPAARMVGKSGPMPLEDFNRVIAINLSGTFNTMRLVANAMSTLPPDPETGERGVIVNTASIAAWEGQIGQLAYSASKGGIVAMTLPAARELASLGIRVNAIAPGLVATPLLLAMPEAVQTSLAESVTFPKRLGKPEEFASLVGHIVENTYLNGEVIRMDGALRMQAR